MLECEYYEQLLHEKDLMLEKAATVVECLKQDLGKILKQHQHCQEQYEDFVQTCQNWDQQKEIQQIKKLLAKQTITCHQEQFKISNLQFNYRNELKLSLLREENLKEFLVYTNNNVLKLISVFSKCIEDPISQGIQQIIFEFKIWEKSQELNSALQLQIADHQMLSYSQLLTGYKDLQEHQKQLSSDQDYEKYLLELDQLNEQQVQLNNIIINNNQIIQKMNDKITEQQKYLNEANTHLGHLNEQINDLKQQNSKLQTELSNQTSAASILKQQIANFHNQQLEYLHMIDDYEQLLQQRVDIEDYTKVAKLFEQSLIDLEKLQEKFEKKQSELEQVKVQLKDSKIMFNSIVTEIKEQLETFMQNPCNIMCLSKMISQCDKYVSFSKSNNCILQSIKINNHLPKHNSFIRRTTQKFSQCQFEKTMNA